MLHDVLQITAESLITFINIFIVIRYGKQINELAGQDLTTMKVIGMQTRLLHTQGEHINSLQQRIAELEKKCAEK